MKLRHTFRTLVNVLSLRCFQKFAKECSFLNRQHRDESILSGMSFNTNPRRLCLGGVSRRGETTCYGAMHARRLEDRIRGLTEHALVAHEHELRIVMAELRSCFWSMRTA